MNQVTLLEVLAAARRGQAPLAPESAGYLALAAADAVVRAPQCLDAAHVALSTEGTVSIPRGEVSSTIDAERSLRALLAGLLALASSPTPALAAAARREASGGVSSLVAELEGALIPVNRSAARRALARLARETDRAKEAGHLRGAAKAQAKQPRPAQATRAKAKPAPVRAAPPPREPTPEVAPIADALSNESWPAAQAMSYAEDPQDALTAPIPARELSPEPPTPHHQALLALHDLAEDDQPASPMEEAFDALEQPSFEQTGEGHEEPLHGEAASFFAGSETFHTFEESALPGPIEVLPEPTDVEALPALTDALEAASSEERVAIEIVEEEAPVAIADESIAALDASDEIAPTSSRNELPPSVPRLMIDPVITLVPGTTPSPPTTAKLFTNLPKDPPRAPVVIKEPAPVPKLSTKPAASVESLVESFVSEQRFDERAAALALKRSVGLDATPPPPTTMSIAIPAKVDLEAEPPHDASPMPAPTSYEPRPPRAPKTSRALMFGLVLLALGATAAVWAAHPSFFVGH